MYPKKSQWKEARTVLVEMAQWLQCDNSNDYVTLLEKEGPAIFLRATGGE